MKAVKYPGYSRIEHTQPIADLMRDILKTNHYPIRQTLLSKLTKYKLPHENYYILGAQETKDADGSFIGRTVYRVLDKDPNVVSFKIDNARYYQFLQKDLP